MKHSIHLTQYDISITYSRCDGYIARRAAILLAKQIEDAGEGAAPLSGSSFIIAFAEERSGDYRIKAEDGRVEITVGGILAWECVKNYAARLLAEGLHPYSAEGNCTNEFADANKFAFARAGDHRIMFYNVLWGGRPAHAPEERNVMAAEIFREFSPAVVALQECGYDKRSSIKAIDIMTEINRVGYVEVAYETSPEQYKGYNCTPLVYDPNQVTLLESAHHWYTQQSERASLQDQSSKSLTWGVFEDKKTGERYAVVGTHMCTQDDAIRETQAAEAYAICAQIKEKYNVPVVIGGDFNSLITHRGYLYYREAGCVDAYEVAKLYRSDARRHHPYPAYQFDLGLVMPTDGAMYGAAEKSVDHILYPYMQDRITTYVYGTVINDYSLASSDHFPVFVDISFA